MLSRGAMTIGNDSYHNKHMWHKYSLAEVEKLDVLYLDSVFGVP